MQNLLLNMSNLIPGNVFKLHASFRKLLLFQSIKTRIEIKNIPFIWAQISSIALY